MKALRRFVSVWATRAGIVLMRVLAVCPLPLTRALGVLLGGVLYVLVLSRRRVVEANFALCFPAWSAAAQRQNTWRVFVHFAQAWLDRAWLWHAPKPWVARRVTLHGALHELQGTAPTVFFLPHFVGLDAAWAGVALRVHRLSTTIYTDQSNKQVDQWILQGRQRFGTLRLFGRADGIKPIVTALREGQPLYLLPDMDFGPDDSVFVPFYGVPTATVTSLSRFARLGRAKVVPLLPRLTPSGYEVEVLPAWPDFPTDNPVADAALMNQRLEAYIATMPTQYYWVHKRFKTRPDGAPCVY